MWTGSYCADVSEDPTISINRKYDISSYRMLQYFGSPTRLPGVTLQKIAKCTLTDVRIYTLTYDKIDRLALRRKKRNTSCREHLSPSFPLH